MLGVRSRTSKILESELLQIPSPKLAGPISEFEPMDSGNEFELPPPFTDANTRKFYSIKDIYEGLYLNSCSTGKKQRLIASDLKYIFLIYGSFVGNYFKEGLSPINLVN
ncbi:unnamed protein product [Lactuca virosa]|uniref:Uncharacterized protein n=1 Tax=Lactuca virosa TaxID=75947 RepID=A0AAU9M586_9ASTR|nr:unnamed protein product [Lactuca virosa]